MKSRTNDSNIDKNLLYNDGSIFNLDEQKQIS